jgi:sugar-specific transcriptional regulator TrmB
MTFEEEDIQTLSKLGLSVSQTKVYLSLYTLGKANGKTIWKCSGVARQDIYRVLTELQEKGLIEKTISKPTEFRAVPIQEGLELLLIRKNKEISEIEEKTKKLLHKIKKVQEEKEPIEENAQFYLVPAKDAAWQKIKKCISKSQHSVDIAIDWKKFLQLTSTHMDDFITALNRGVKYRWVITRPVEDEMLPKFVNECIEKLSCQLKFALSSSPKASVAVFDQKEVLIATEAEMPFYLDSAMLWSNNSSFGTAMQHYFDLMWEKAQEAKL